MKSKIKNLNVLLFFAIMAFAMACVIIPPSGVPTSSASVNDEYYESGYKNEKIIVQAPDNGYTDNNSSYIKNLVTNSSALFNAAYSNYLNATSIYSTVTGQIIADSPIGKIVQYVKNTKIINADGTKYSEAISYSSNGSGVKTAEQVYARGNVVKYRNTSSVNSALVASYGNSWNGSITTLSAYASAIGKEVARISYIVSDKTIESISAVKDNGNGTYTLTVNFISAAGNNYKKEIVRTGGYPVGEFKKLQMICVIGSDINFKSIQFNEVYTVKAFGMSVETFTDESRTGVKFIETFHSIGAFTTIPGAENLP